MRLPIFLVAELALLSAIACGSPESEAVDPTANLPADRCFAPYFQVSSGETSTERFPLRSTDTKVTIAGVIAQVEVKQLYANLGSKPIEATYLFPASTRAAVHGMEMRLGERRIRAEIQERKQAKETYEKAKEEKKAASLLEQHRPNVFQMHVANILSGEEVEVTLRYSEILKPNDGIYEFVYPTVVGPRYSNRGSESPDATAHEWVANPYLEDHDNAPTAFRFSLEMSAGLPIQSLTCPSHNAELTFAGKSQATMELKGMDAANRDIIVRYQLQDRNISSGLLLHEGPKESFFLLNVQPPERVKPEDIPPRDYVFIVDVSGSMEGFPLDLAKDLFNDLIGSLRPEDSFNIILFAGSSQALSKHPVPATAENVRRGVDFLGRQKGGGGTELVSALNDAMSLPGHEERSRSVIVITDGYVSMEAGAFQMVREKLGQANLFAFGIGSSVNRHLIEGLARVGGGEPFVVTKPSEGELVAAQLRDYVSSPVLTNIRIESKDVTALDLEPHSPPDVFAARPLTLTGKYSGKPTGSIVVSGLTGNGERFHQEFDLAEAALADADNPALRSLWARERVRGLVDYASLSEEDEAVKAVTNLGLTYELLTPYTSFVAVDEVVRDIPDGAPESVPQPLPLPQGVSKSAVVSFATKNYAGSGGQVPEPGLPVLILAGLSLFAFRRSRPMRSEARLSVMGW